MMCRKTSSRWAATKALLVVPMVAVALGAFATTVYVPREVQSKGNEKIGNEQKTSFAIRSVLKISDEKLLLNGEEITAEELQERVMGLVDDIVLQVDNLTPMGRVADVKEVLRANADLKITYESVPEKSDPIIVVDGKVVSAEEGLLKLRLTDEKGAPVVGAVVVKAGTNEGICTDPEGRGTLQVKVGDKLVCSMIGKETIHYTVAQLPTEELTLQLKTEMVEIDELVVVGYGAEEQTKAAADEEAVPFMLVDDERKKEIMAQHKRDMEQAKADLETAKAELEKAKAELRQAKPATDEEVFLIVEQMPTFEGGDIHTFRQWVQMRVQYPKELQEAGVSGRVIVQFEVDTDGSVGSVQTLRTPDKRLSDQVVELVKKSPKWQPGMQRGVAVKVSMTFPIEFKMNAMSADQQQAMHRLADSARAKGHTPQELKGRMGGAKLTVKPSSNGVIPAQAEFAGGDYRQFRAWVQERLRYPKGAKADGEVFVTFVVKANGEVGDVDVIGEADKALAEEVVRVVKSSPAWKPATKQGKAVDAKYGIEFAFAKSVQPAETDK